MRERVDNFWIARKGPQPNALATHFLEGPEECIFTIDINTPSTANSSSPSYPASSAGPSAYDNAVFQAELIQAQIDSLREAQVLALERGKKLQFDSVEIMKRAGPPKPGSLIPPPPSPPKPNVFTRGPAPARDIAPVPNQQSNHSPNVIGKPGARAGNNQPQRPQGPMRPIAIPPKPAAEDPKYCYLCPLEFSVKPTDLADRALDVKITISARKLLAASPDVQKQVKDLVTSKKVSANAVEVNNVDAYLANGLESNPSAVYLDLFKYDSSASSAAASLPL